MRDPQKFAGALVNLGIIQYKYLPPDVRDELCDDCPGNDTGSICNPHYRPKFKAWLEKENMPEAPYIIWWSW